MHYFDMTIVLLSVFSVIKGILDSKTAETQGILNIDELGDCLDAFGFTFDDDDVDFLKKHFDDNGKYLLSYYPSK